MTMQTLDCEHLSAQQFLELVHAAMPREQIVYATGHLAQTVDYAGENGRALREVAKEALRAGETGLVCLVQHKIPRGDEWVYEYVAIKRAVAKKAA